MRRIPQKSAERDGAASRRRRRFARLRFGGALESASEELREDREERRLGRAGDSGPGRRLQRRGASRACWLAQVVQAAVLNGAPVPPAFNNDRELVLEAQHSGNSDCDFAQDAEHAAPVLREAVRLDGLALELASKELRDDEEAGSTLVARTRI